MVFTSQGDGICFFAAKNLLSSILHKYLGVMKEQYLEDM